jgi:hypothetical protein
MAGMHGEGFNFHVSAETLRIPRGLSIHSTSLAPSLKATAARAGHALRRFAFDAMFFRRK